MSCIKKFGRPEAEQVRRLDGGALDDHCPSLVYGPVDFAKADIESFTSEVKFVDFAESYLTAGLDVPDLSAFHRFILRTRGVVLGGQANSVLRHLGVGLHLVRAKIGSSIV